MTPLWLDPDASLSVAAFFNPLSHEFQTALTSASKGKGIFKIEVTDGCTAAEATFTAALPGQGAFPQGEGAYGAAWVLRQETHCLVMLDCKTPQKRKLCLRAGPEER